MRLHLAPFPKRSRIIIGLMAGTSCDGVDAAMVEISGAGAGRRVRLLRHDYTPYPHSLRQRIASLASDSPADICSMNFELGRFFGKAALSTMLRSGLTASGIDAVASHGQTIIHIPPGPGRKGSTLQIGEPAVIAAQTGLPVVSDFRTADMARGGQGAPLVPYADYILFRQKVTVRAVQNIGGIANVTVVTPEAGSVIAFDTGPGNAPINHAMELLFERPLDRNGAIARAGKADKRLLDELLSHPFLRQRPPKSTGTDVFGKALVEGILARRRISPRDLVATLTLFTARSIRDAYERFVLGKYPLGEIILCGGGARNTFLRETIGELFRPVPVAISDDYGIPATAKEALSFAILANETLSGKPSNLPGVTGASGPAVLGSITLP